MLFYLPFELTNERENDAEREWENVHFSPFTRVYCSGQTWIVVIYDDTTDWNAKTWKMQKAILIYVATTWRTKTTEPTEPRQKIERTRKNKKSEQTSTIPLEFLTTPCAPFTIFGCALCLTVSPTTIVCESYLRSCGLYSMAMEYGRKHRPKTNDKKLFLLKHNINSKWSVTFTSLVFCVR